MALELEWTTNSVLFVDLPDQRKKENVVSENQESIRIKAKVKDSSCFVCNANLC